MLRSYFCSKNIFKICWSYFFKKKKVKENWKKNICVSCFQCFLTFWHFWASCFLKIVCFLKKTHSWSVYRLRIGSVFLFSILLVRLLKILAAKQLSCLQSSWSMNKQRKTTKMGRWFFALRLYTFTFIQIIATVLSHNYHTVSLKGNLYILILYLNFDPYQIFKSALAFLADIYH